MKYQLLKIPFLQSLSLSKLNEIILVLLSIFLYLFYKQRDLWSILFAIFTIIFLLNKPYYIIYSLMIFGVMVVVDQIFFQHHLDHIDGKYRVKKIMSSGIVIKEGGNNIFVRTKEHFRLRDIISVSGNVTRPKNFSDFNYIGYLKTKNIENIISFPKITLLEKSHDIRSLAREYLSSGPKTYREIAPLMIIGQKTSESKAFYDLSVRLSIVHLFVISGFHISLFYLIVSKGLALMKVNNKIAGWFALLLILIYLFLLNFPISASRAALLTFFIFINKNYLKNKFSSLEILAFIMGLFIIYHPWMIKSLSFIFTFIATGIISWINSWKIEKTWLKNIFIIVGVYLSTLFISININGYLSLFGLFFGVILTPVFSFMFIISIFLFPFKDLMSHIYWFFEQILYMFNSYNILIDTPWVTKEISKVIYLLSFSCFIILKIWSLSTDKRVT